MERVNLWLGRVAGALCIVVGLIEVVSFFSVESSRGSYTPATSRALGAAIAIGFGSIIVSLNRAVVTGGLLAMIGSALLVVKPLAFPMQYERLNGDVVRFGLTSETHLYFLVPALLLFLLAVIVLPVRFLPWSTSGREKRRAVASVFSAGVSVLIGFFMGVAFFGGSGRLAAAVTVLLPGVVCVLAGVAQFFLTLSQFMKPREGGKPVSEHNAVAAALAPTELPSRAAEVDSMRSLLEAIAYAPGAPASVHGEDPLVGQRLDRYQLEERLGAGGMGAVYRAMDLRLHRPVAIKLIRPSAVGRPELKARLLREARAAAQINHQNVISVYDVCELEIGPCIVMELIDGVSLRTRIESGPLEPIEAKDVALQVARALVAAHEHGVIHRDLKPDNIIVTPQAIVKVLDFGLARFEHGFTADTQPFVTSEGKLLGTPAYMSPEQVDGSAIDTRTDIFSFGVLTFELCTGTSPFIRSTMLATYDAVRRVEIAPELWGRVPAQLRPLLERCLQHDPSDRWRSAIELEGHLMMESSG